MTTDTVGGVWTYTMELCGALGRAGAEVVLATMGDWPNAEQQAEAAGRPGVELHPSDYRLEWMDDAWRDVGAAGRWLLELERQAQPDVIHLNDYAHGDLPWRHPVVIVGHSCVLSWWRAVKGIDAPPEWDEYARRVRAGLTAADAVIAPTQAMLAALERHHGTMGRRGVILNGRAPNGFHRQGKRPIVLSAGRLWDEATNVAALARVADRLTWPVYVAGEAHHPGGAIAPLAGVHALGRLGPKAMTRWYARATIYALPARYEPFGLTPLEAALSGCALVLGDIPSLREIWGDAALYAPPDDAEALADAIERLIASPPLREAMADAAWRRARQCSPQRMARGYLSLYRELCHRPSICRRRTAGTRRSPVGTKVTGARV